MQLKSCLFATSLILISPSVLAEDNTQFIYYGAAVQYSEFSEIDFNNQQLELLDNELTTNSNNYGMRIFTGYQFLTYMGIEVGLSSVPVTSYKLKAPAVNESGDRETLSKGEIDLYAADIRFQGLYPLSNSRFVKGFVGYQYFEGNDSQLGQVDSTFSNQSSDLSESGFQYGIGIGQSMSRSVALLIELQNSSISQLKQNTLTLSFMSKF